MGYKTKEERHADYLKNKDKQLEQTRLRYLNNPEKYKEYQRQYRKANSELILERTRKKRKERMDLAISILGGKCHKCENVFDNCQYDFHHVDPSEKDFTVSEGILLGKDRFFNEIKKCILLCANCHRLEHKETYN